MRFSHLYNLHLHHLFLCWKTRKWAKKDPYCYPINKHVSANLVSFQYDKYSKSNDHTLVNVLRNAMVFTGQYWGLEPNDVSAAATPEQPDQSASLGVKTRLCFHITGQKRVATHVRHLLRTMLEQLHMHDNHFHCFVLLQLPISLCRSIGDT